MNGGMGFLIANTIEQYEGAIRAHPPEVSHLYFRGLEPFLGGVAEAGLGPRYVRLGISMDEVLAIHRLIFCASFISAWYHLNRNAKMRNQVTNACIAMIAPAGLEPEVLMPAYVKMEQDWRRTLASTGVGGGSLLAKVLVAAVVIGILWAALR